MDETTTKMNQAVKTVWLEALRSGRYVQGLGVLRSTNDEFCCLGVLCEQAVLAGVIDSPELRTLTVSGAEVDDWVYDGCVTVPSTNVEGWAGMPTTSVINHPIGGDYSLSEYKNSSVMILATLNDHEQLNFEQIADWIEENL